MESGDPNAIRALVERYPAQVDGLLKLAAYCSTAGQLELSAEFVERALHACERALHPLCTLLDGSARLRWSEPNNRPFFVALHRHMINVGRKGCPRTALELGRLLLSLDPDADPLHALLHLDAYALRSGEAEWLLRLPRQLPTHSLALYPNTAFSSALALRALGRVNDGSADLATGQLRRALLLFPAALPMLLRKAAPESPRALLAIDEWTSAIGADDASGRTLGKLLRLYVAKTVDQWADASTTAWLVDEAIALAACLRAADAPSCALRDDLAHVAAAEYGEASRAIDEFALADPDDFEPTPPAALPEDLLPQPGDAAAAGGRWRPVRAPRPAGRLVVPREEWVVLERATGAAATFVTFWRSLLPWTVAPARARRD